MQFPIKILIIEDNPGDSYLLQHFLQLSGVQIGSIKEAQKISFAKRLLQVEKPDIIFLDLFLPDSAGLDTFWSINTRANEVPIIILSGLQDTEIAIQAIQAGAQDFLLKGDFNENMLSKAVSYSIERKKIQERLNHNLQMHELVGKATNDIIWDWDFKSSKISYFSKAVFSNFGYSSKHLGDTLAWWQHKIHPGDIQELATAIKQAISAKGKKVSKQFRFLCANNKYKYVYGRAYLFYKSGVKPYRMIAVLQDITEIKMLQYQITREKMLRQQQITEATIRSQEKEREEIGKELHDNINQILATSKMFIDIAIKNKLLREELLPKSFEYLNAAIEEIRKLSRSLVPPALEDIGLVEAIQELVDAYDSSNVDIQFVQESNLEIEIEPAVQLMMYRVVQEGVANAIKHANASKILVNLIREPAQLQVSISDNGIGFIDNSKSNGIGLRNIRSRAAVYNGKVKLNSNPDGGSLLVVTIPFGIAEAAQK